MGSRQYQVMTAKGGPADGETLLVAGAMMGDSINIPDRSRYLPPHRYLVGTYELRYVGQRKLTLFERIVKLFRRNK